MNVTQDHRSVGSPQRGIQLGNSATSAMPPVLDRLLQLRSYLLSLSAHLNAFESRINGGLPEKTGGATGDYPPCSIEDVVSHIEQISSDIEMAHNRLAVRF